MNTKLDFGQVFDRTIDIYKTHFKTLIATAAAVFATVLVIALIGGIAIGSHPTGGTVIFVAVVTGLVSYIAGYVFTGMVIRIVQSHGDGREHSLGELYESVKPVIVPLIFTSIIAGVALGAVMLVLLLPGIAAGSFGLVALGFLAALPILVFMAVHFAVIAPVVVVERINYIDAIKRSWAMVKGNAWIVFAVILVMGIVLSIAGAILGGIGSAFGSGIGRAVFQFIANVLIAPFPAIAGAVMYFMLGGATAPAAPGAPMAPPAGGITPPPSVPGVGPAVAGSKPPPPPPPGT